MTTNPLLTLSPRTSRIGSPSAADRRASSSSQSDPRSTILLTPQEPHSSPDVDASTRPPSPDFPPSISQRKAHVEMDSRDDTPRGTARANEGMELYGLGIGMLTPPEEGRRVRKMRSIERTRFWAEDVGRHRDFSNLGESSRAPIPQLSGRGVESAASSKSDSPPADQVESSTTWRSKRVPSPLQLGPLVDEPPNRTGHNRSDSPQPLPSSPITPNRYNSAAEVVSSPRLPILSIDDIVNRHRNALLDTEAAARNRARLELGLPIVFPKMETETFAASSPSTPRQRTKRSSPVIPSRTSSSPGVKVSVIPPRHSSKSNLNSVSPEPQSPRSSNLGRFSVDTDTRTTTTSSGESVLRNALLNQAALDSLERDISSETPSSPPMVRRVSFQISETDRPSLDRSQSATPSKSPRKSLGLMSRSRESPLGSRSGTPTIREDEDADAHAVAVYLRLPNLNLSFAFPLPYPDKPLNVSVAEVGCPHGRPVVIFLGLGCVRYLIALFDDLARAYNLRLICIDRWGYGKTDAVKDERRGLREWAAVVEKVLDKMKVKQFAVLAHSAGAPYAIAAANRMKERILGRLHLLAPWVSTDVDGGYKWLKWIPNGVIKSATAADWYLQSYVLGKPPPLLNRSTGMHAPVSSESLGLTPSRNSSSTNLNISVGGGVTRKSSLLRRASSKMLRAKSLEPDYNLDTTERPGFGRAASSLGFGRSPAVENLKMLAARHGSSQALPTYASTRTDSVPGLTASSGSVLSLQLQSPHNGSRKHLDFGLSEGFDTFATDLKFHLPGSTTSESSRSLGLPSTYSSELGSRFDAAAPTLPSEGFSSVSTPTGPLFGLALQQASHAECEPGTTSDLLSIVLNRDGASSLNQFAYELDYASFDLSAKIWYGADDDKISEKSMRWIEQTMGHGKGVVELSIIEREGHDVLTSPGVVFEVFKSLVEDLDEMAVTGVRK